MTPNMKQIGDGNINSFFDEYVFGTALPSYGLTTPRTPMAGGPPNAGCSTSAFPSTYLGIEIIGSTTRDGWEAS